MAKLAVETLDREIQQLPSLSIVVMEVLELMDGGKVSLLSLMKKIAQDQALAGRVLRVANSPFYGLSRHIANLKEAGVILGLHTLRNIVTAAGFIERFPAGEAGGFDRVEFWRHAVGTGVTAKVLARRCGIDPEAAFTAGLLHDIGKLVLDAHFPEVFSEVLACRDSRDCLLREAEEAVLGFDHTVIGGKVANQWKLPDQIEETIRYHHTPEREPDSRVTGLVHVADIVCRGLEIGSGGDDLIPRLWPGAMERLGLGWGALKGSLGEIEDLNAAANILVAA